MTNTITETKAQRVERLKREKNPWEGLDEIRRFAREGFGSIPPEWIGTYFRWWGVYTQGDGAGVTGGANGEGKALERFMVRIRIPNGILHSSQLRTIASLTRTLRQWNRRPHRPAKHPTPLGHHREPAEVIEELWSVGLNTMGACGDVIRNVTGCPVAGIDHRRTLRCVAPGARVVRTLSRATPISTICRANSKSPSRDARSGAPILRSTTLGSPP